MERPAIYLRCEGVISENEYDVQCAQYDIKPVCSRNLGERNTMAYLIDKTNKNNRISVTISDIARLWC